MTKGNFSVKWVTIYFVIMGCCLWNIFNKHVRAWCGCRCGSEWKSSLFDRNLVLFRIEIPLFHVLNARITFENVNGCRTADKTASQMAGGAQCDSGKEWKMQRSHLFTFLSVECTEERDGLTAENETSTGEGKLQCITADLECAVPIVLTHSAPSMAARLTKLRSSKLSPVFWGLKSGASYRYGKWNAKCVSHSWVCNALSEKSGLVWVGCSWLRISSDTLSCELLQTHSLGITSEEPPWYLFFATFLFSQVVLLRVQPP